MKEKRVNKRREKQRRFITLFSVAILGVPFVVGAASDFAVPDWGVTYSVSGADVLADGEYALSLGVSLPSVYGWPAGSVGVGTVYGDLYKGEMNAGEFVAGRELVGSESATSSDTFLATGRYFVVVYEFDPGSCEGGGGDFCVLPVIDDARYWFTHYRAAYEDCVLFAEDPVFCVTPLSFFGIKHFGYIPFSVIDGAVVPPPVPPPPPPVPDAFSNVAFLPGIEASRLYAHEGAGEKWLWEPQRNSDIVRLFLNPDGTSIETGIYMRDIIDESNSLPLTPPPLFGFNIYKNFMSFMDGLVASSTIREWRAFPYDWRMDLSDVVAHGALLADGSFLDIVAGIEDLASTSATGKVTIIGHSNGGLLGKLIIDEVVSRGEAGIVDKLILVATPQVGAPKALSGLLHGDGLDMPEGFGFLMDKVNARELATNMPSAYTLLPSSGYIGRVVDPVIEFDSFASVLADFRSRYGLAINTAPELRSFLLGDDGVRTRPETIDTETPNVANRVLLDKAEALQNHLDTWTAPSGVSVFQIAGWGLSTVRGIYYTQRNVMKCNDNLSVCLPTPILDRLPLFTNDGDTTVVSPSATFIDGVGTYYVDLKKYNDTVFVGREHASILEAIPSQEIVQHIISEDTVSFPHFTSATKPNRGNSLRIRVHSPVSLDVYDSHRNHTGIVSDDDLRFIEERIPNSSYMEFGEGKYINLDGEDTYTISLNGQSTGTFTLALDTVVDDSVSTSTVYENIPVTANTLAHLSFSPTTTDPVLVIDTNGDGVADETLHTGSHPDLHAYAELMEETLKQMDIASQTKKKIEKPLDDIEDSLKYLPLTLKQQKKIDKKLIELKETIQKLGKKKNTLSHSDAEVLISMVEQLRLLVVQ